MSCKTPLKIQTKIHMPFKYLKSMRGNLPVYCMAVLFAMVAGWGILNVFEDRNFQKSQSISYHDDVPAVENRGYPKASGAVSKGSNASKLQSDERNNTATVKLKLVPVINISFVTRSEPPAPDHKHWNKPHDLYLIESSVWYGLYDQDEKKIFRFPNYINVDARGRPGAIDRAGVDIKWQWADDYSVIGVQQIVQKVESLPLKGLAREFAESHPDSVRIYLYDVRKLNTVYELIPPEAPKGFVVRIEGISDDGHISLAALSPKGYNQGDDLQNDPSHYKYLGIYKYLK